MEIYPVYKQTEPLRVIENTVRWLGVATKLRRDIAQSRKFAAVTTATTMVLSLVEADGLIRLSGASSECNLAVTRINSDSSP